MDEPPRITSHYAILIGIDEYPNRALRSCVRDVKDAQIYLKNTLKDAINIQMITTGEADSERSDQTSAPSLWPTSDNLISVLDATASAARQGNFVYIHYSGHGTRKPPSGEFASQSTGDLALVLLTDGDGEGISYLWGYKLAELLNAMTDKGLVVTLILDCCFSASVYRHEDTADIRFFPYRPEDETEALAGPENNWKPKEPTYRNASTLPNWLINPDQYAILSACGPHEVATEPKFDGQRHGALSYLLLDTLKKVGLKKTHKDIYNHVRAKFRASGFNRQHPVLYGNPNQGFFGEPKDSYAIGAVSVVSKNDALELQAGSAHAICDGDKFILRPFGTEKDYAQPREAAVMAIVKCTRPLTSDLKLLASLSTRIRTGWIAEPLTRLSLQQFPIRLPADVPQRDEWVSALNKRSLVVHDVSTTPFVFDVVVDDSKHYQVLSSAGDRINSLPRMAQDQTTISQLITKLEHLAKFWLVRSLNNEASMTLFRESFDVYIQSGGREYRPEDLLEINHGAIAELIVKNQDQRVGYVFVYNLGPCWQVENIYRGTYLVATPRNEGERFTGTRRIKLQMKVPDEILLQGHRSCEDIVKVFVTSRPASFDLLELPKLGTPIKTVEENRTDQVSNEPEDWVAMNFRILTSLKQ